MSPGKRKQTCRVQILSCVLAFDCHHIPTPSNLKDEVDLVLLLVALAQRLPFAPPQVDVVVDILEVDVHDAVGRRTEHPRSVSTGVGVASSGSNVNTKETPEFDQRTPNRPGKR